MHVKLRITFFQQGLAQLSEDLSYASYAKSSSKAKHTCCRQAATCSFCTNLSKINRNVAMPLVMPLPARHKLEQIDARALLPKKLMQGLALKAEVLGNIYHAQAVEPVLEQPAYSFDR